MTATAWHAARRAALVEDAAWMAATGETTLGAARRLHMAPNSLRTALSVSYTHL